MSGPGFLRDSLGEDEHLWIAARPNSAGRFPPGSLNSAGQPPWAPGNRCGLIRGEDVIIYMPVVCVCVYVRARACVCFPIVNAVYCSHTSSCFPVPFDLWDNLLRATQAAGCSQRDQRPLRPTFPPHTHTPFILDNREVNHSCLFHHLSFLSLSLS